MIFLNYECYLIFKRHHQKINPSSRIFKQEFKIIFSKKGGYVQISDNVYHWQNMPAAGVKQRNALEADFPPSKDFPPTKLLARLTWPDA